MTTPTARGRGHTAIMGRAVVRERPVFVDRAGVRRRLTRMVGLGLGVGAMALLGLLVTAVAAAGPRSVPHVPADPGTAPAAPRR